MSDNDFLEDDDEQDTAGHYFQSDAQLSEADRKAAKKAGIGKTAGNVIKLDSKINAVIADVDDESCIFVAESTGQVRRVNLVNGAKDHIVRGPAGVFGCLAYAPSGITKGDPVLFAGHWNGSIYSWSVRSRKLIRTYSGHAKDKAVTALGVKAQRPMERNLLISGAKDNKIVIWDIDSGSILQSLTNHTRGVLSLAVGAILDHGREAFRFFSADSLREIRVWRYKASDPASESQQEPTKGATSVAEECTISDAHETSINALHLSTTWSDDKQQVDHLWTASTDKTAKCLEMTYSPGLSKEDDGVGDYKAHKVSQTLQHPSYVRAIAVDTENGLVITGCEDEEIRVWDEETGELVHTYSGHFEPVTDLVVLPRRNEVVSVSFDMTIRRWSLDRNVMRKLKEEAKKKPDAAAQPKKTGPELTAEEEAELAELMDDDDD
ncbi:hypothetical protein LTS18_006610 [Coniosporium uncinatum]|uniref:Uncharacterized protein n=1 Tax=Coniosporium uncinatum TaxID=93489 RepID=A0ACC3DXA9_9PEZI|nr:hypothetical protein LTS18_006610 [Coniosporium uncinatum]